MIKGSVESSLGGFVIVYTTIGTIEDAQVLAKQVVQAGYAACVNIIPGVVSVYTWNGAIESAAECAMLFKTTNHCLPDLERYIAKLHPYGLPALIRIKAEASPAFFDFVARSVNQSRVDVQN